MKILIIDDVPQAIELIRETLLLAGLAAPDSSDIREAHSVQEARWELFRHRPDLMVVDEVLPGESPLDLLQEPAFSDIPVILVSATAHTSKAPTIASPERLRGRFSKWGWADLNRVAAEIQKIGLTLKSPQG